MTANKSVGKGVPADRDVSDVDDTIAFLDYAAVRRLERMKKHAQPVSFGTNDLRQSWPLPYTSA